MSSNGARMKHIAILGSTGSIGRSSLEVIANFPDEFRVSYLTTNKNIDLLSEQIKQFQPKGVVVLEECSASVMRKLMNGTTALLNGEEGLLDMVGRDDVDVVISSLVGFAGLKPTIRAIERGKDVALANKETLVVAGEIIMNLVRKHGVNLIPVDSEHSAILQCLIGEEKSSIAKLILTASGGPFLHTPKSDFEHVTVAEALNHPNWKMGNKVTIDSATLMNKGLEVIEAHWLFGLPPENIEVVIHPQSIIHSMVEFVDGSVKAQLGVPDMKIPIQYALTYPQRSPSNYKRVDFSTLRELTFFKPDLEKFECLALAFRALTMGGTAPAVLNAANEVAVELFLDNRIRFSEIPQLIRLALDNHKTKLQPTLDDVIEADRTTRVFVRGLQG
jgi:1-deoxy-D-xylulose-5-phosphate reductoisomerase